METNNSFGSKVRRLRIEHRMTMEDIERGTGISRSSIYRWEHGRSMPNSWKTVQLLADFFHVPVHWLMDENNGEMPLLSAIQELEHRVSHLESLLMTDAHYGQ